MSVTVARIEQLKGFYNVCNKLRFQENLFCGFRVVTFALTDRLTGSAILVTAPIGREILYETLQAGMFDELSIYLIRNHVILLVPSTEVYQRDHKLTEVRPDI